MLVLTRRLGEKIHIGDDITVTVLDIDGMKIRLGIDAPSTTQIWRAELSKRIAEETPTPRNLLPEPMVENATR